VDGEGAAQQHRGVGSTDRERDEVTRLGLLGDAVGDDGHVVIGGDPLHREDLAADLNRHHRAAFRSA
jgi:hypothetical protein